MHFIILFVEQKGLAKQKEFDIIFSEEKPIFVWGDEFKAEDVLSNYVSNAINHCSGEKKIIISIKEMDDKVRVNVYNTGDQIPEESLSHLYEKFYKVDKARTRDYGGSGIGLSIVKAIQESINQQYGVINEENGVSFWFEMELLIYLMKHMLLVEWIMVLHLLIWLKLMLALLMVVIT